MSYNGYTSYETWCVSLWIDNDEGTYAQLCQMADDYAKDDVYEFGKAIKDYVEQNMIPDLGASLAADLLGAALQEVDWNDIAENRLADQEGMICDGFRT